MSTVFPRVQSDLHGDFTALYAFFCLQALWRCWYHFPLRLGAAHTAKSTKSWSNDHGIAVLEWPVKPSESLNLSESVNMSLGRCIKKRPNQVLSYFQPVILPHMWKWKILQSLLRAFVTLMKKFLTHFSRYSSLCYRIRIIHENYTITYLYRPVVGQLLSYFIWPHSCYSRLYRWLAKLHSSKNFHFMHLGGNLELIARSLCISIILPEIQ